MTPLSIALICVFLQVALTFWAVVRMGMVRVNSHKAREVSFGDIALDSGAYPETVTPFTNNVNNQFQTPVLLYSVVAIAAATDSANWVLAAGAVVFVASRLVHHAIHVGKNNVIHRFNAYLTGLAGLFVAWVALGISLLGVI